MANPRLVALHLGLALLHAACSSTTSTSVSMTVGQTGGTVSAAMGIASGASVVVPAGALNDSVTITLGVGDSAVGLPAGLTAAGPAIVLGPEGQTFGAPVTVTIPATQAATGMYTRPLSGSAWTLVAGATYDAAGGKVVGQVDHFSVFVAVAAGTPHPASGTGGRKMLVDAQGARVIGFIHFSQDPQALCLYLENAPMPIPSTYLLDIDCPGKCEYQLAPSGQVNACFRAIMPGDTTFGGSWSGDCTRRIYPDVPWPEYGVVASNETRDLSCVVRP